MEYVQFRVLLPSEEWKRKAIEADLKADGWSSSQIHQTTRYIHFWPSSKQSLMVSSDIEEQALKDLSVQEMYSYIFKWSEACRKFPTMDRHAECRVCGREKSKDHDGETRCYMYDEGEETVNDWIMHCSKVGPSPAFENLYPGDRDGDDDGDDDGERNLKTMDFTQVDHTVTFQKALGLDFTSGPGWRSEEPTVLNNKKKMGFDFSNGGKPFVPINYAVMAEDLRTIASSYLPPGEGPFGYNPPPSSPMPRFVGDPFGARSKFVGNPIADVLQSVRVSPINYNSMEGKNILLLLP